MKSLLAAVGAGFIAAAMLTQPADAAPRCAWKGTYWQCWNGHAWYRDRDRRDEARHMGRELRRDMFYGSSDRRDWRHDRHDWRYGR